MKRAAFAVLAIGIVAGMTPSAEAAFPGRNGKLAVALDDTQIPRSGDIWTVTPTDVVEFLDGDPDYSEPAWSPDGTRMTLAGRTCSGSFCSPSDIYVINADGTGLTQLTDGPENDVSPVWSPDGEQIAFTRTAPTFAAFAVHVMNADGSGETQLTDGAFPSWSPDGTEIAFARPAGVHAVAPDGSSLRFVSVGSRPDWSPDGSKLVLLQGGTHFFASNVVTVNRDGTGATPILADGYSNRNPEWSPEGDQIVFDRQYCERDPDFGDTCDKDRDVYRIDPDGSDLEIVTDICCGSYDEEPSWQPLPVNAYVRPKVAGRVNGSLVPAHEQCGSPDRTHGPPLSFPSCSPVAASASITAGTPDSNGAAASFLGSIALSVVPGNHMTPVIDEADVTVKAALKDVRCYADPGPVPTCGEANTTAGDDYTGELSLALSVRMTDRDNSPHPGGHGAGTVEDFELPIPFSCGNNSDPGSGATCNLNTSLDAAFPGAVKELRRTVLEVGMARVRDGGPDGDADTGGNSTFATQGLFAP